MSSVINDWGVPIARFEDDSVMYRVVAPICATPLRGSSLLKGVHKLEEWKPNSDIALFLMMKNGVPELSFQLQIWTTPDDTHVASIKSGFMHNPTQGLELYGRIMWTLVELLGVDIFKPIELSRGACEELFLPIQATPDQMKEAVKANNWIKQRQVEEPNCLRQSQRQAMDDTNHPSFFFALLAATGLIYNFSYSEGVDGLEWRLYLGGPSVLMMSATYKDDGTFAWVVAPWDWSYEISSAPTPLEALMKGNLLMADKDVDKWLDQILPAAQFLIPAEDLEPYALLSAPCPLAWPVGQLIEWARSVEILQATGLWK